MKSEELRATVLKVWLESEVARLNSILKKQRLTSAKRMEICSEFFFGLSVFLDQGAFTVSGRRYSVDFKVRRDDGRSKSIDLHDYSEAIVDRIVDDEDLSTLRVANPQPAPVSASELGTTKSWGVRIEFTGGSLVAFTIVTDLAKSDELLLPELESDLKKLAQRRSSQDLLSRAYLLTPTRDRRPLDRKKLVLTGEDLLRLLREESRKG